jgi:hypothetical protein
MEEEAPQVPPTQVRASIQRHHPVDQILGDISKGVTTRSRLANFCEHYSFVSSIEHYSFVSSIVHHPIEGKFGLPSWPPMASSCLGAIKETPRCMEENTKLT